MFSRFLSELRRRKVIKSLAFYTGGVLAVLQAIASLFPMLQIAAVYQTLVAVALLAGFPVVFYLAWFYDLHAGRLIRATASAEQEAPTALGLWQWLGLVLIVLGSAAAAVLVYQRLATQMQRAEEGQSQLQQAASIAVLPFRDQSPEQDQAFLAHGIAEELTALLGQQPGLQVAAASSSFIAAERGWDPVQTGQQLAVATVLTGSVMVSGDRLKLRVELIDARDGKLLWTQSFPRQLSDMFAVQEEIARAVANLLQDVYLEAGSVSSHASTASSDAYVMYLKGREQYRRQTTEAMKEARRLFEQAIGLDPEYAMAYVGLADSIVLLAKGKSRLGILEPDIASQLAEQNLAKALVRDPKIAEAYAIQGKVLELKQQDENALPMYDKAIALNPNLAIAHMWRYIVLDRLNRKPDAMKALDAALALDPLSVTLMFNRGFELSRRGHFAEARAQYEALIALYPDSPMGHQGLADAAFNNGELALSLEHWRKAGALSPDNPNFRQAYLSVLLSLGMLDEARPLATDPIYTATLLLLGKEYPGLFAHMEFELKARPDDPWLLFEAGWYDYLVGDPARGQTRWLQALPLFAEADLYDAPAPMCSPAIELAFALQQAGRAADANAMAAQCQQRLDQALQQGVVSMNHLYLQARLAALRGDHAAAMAALTQAVERGWREWWTGLDPVLNGIRDQAEAQAVFTEIENRLASERDKARQLLTSP